MSAHRGHKQKEKKMLVKCTSAAKYEEKCSQLKKHKTGKRALEKKRTDNEKTNGVQE